MNWYLSFEYGTSVVKKKMDVATSTDFCQWTDGVWSQILFVFATSLLKTIYPIHRIMLYRTFVLIGTVHLSARYGVQPSLCLQDQV